MVRVLPRVSRDRLPSLRPHYCSHTHVEQMRPNVPTERLRNRKSRACCCLIWQHIFLRLRFSDRKIPYICSPGFRYFLPQGILENHPPCSQLQKRAAALVGGRPPRKRAAACTWLRTFAPSCSIAAGCAFAKFGFVETKVTYNGTTLMSTLQFDLSSKEAFKKTILIHGDRVLGIGQSFCLLFGTR